MVRSDEQWNYIMLKHKNEKYTINLVSLELSK